MQSPTEMRDSINMRTTDNPAKMDTIASIKTPLEIIFSLINSKR